jgi:hypothetical protein
LPAGALKITQAKKAPAYVPTVYKAETAFLLRSFDYTPVRLRRLRQAENVLRGSQILENHTVIGG